MLPILLLTTNDGFVQPPYRLAGSGLFNARPHRQSLWGRRIVGRPVSRVLSSACRWFTGRSLHPIHTRVGDHLSGPARYRGARAAYPELQGDEQPPARKRALPLLGLAPDGGCLAADIAVDAGGLLLHLFTLTGKPGGCFLWSCARFSPPGDYPASCSLERGLSSDCIRNPRSPGRPYDLLYHTAPT
jgi:hypothetical protein